MASILDELVASVRGLGTRVRTYAQTAPVNLTAETAKVGGETEDTVRGKMQSSHVGLGTLVNAAPATPAEVAARTPQVYATRKDAGQIWTEETAHVKGQLGDNLFVGPDKVITGLIPGASLEFINIVTNDAELTAAKEAKESFGEVFNKWKRISRGARHSPANRETAGFSDESVPSELQGWDYNPTTDIVRSTLNTGSMVGFVCPTAYSDYVLDVTLKSDSNWQNDPIGLILGYEKDPDGTTHTLTVYRNYYNLTEEHPFALNVQVDAYCTGYVNIAGKTDGQTVLADYGTKPGLNAPLGQRLRVTRVGDQFTIESTDYDSTAFVPASTFTFNLNDHPSLARFKGSSQYGYTCVSQDLTYWDVHSRPGGRRAVYDMRSGVLWEWDGNNWVINPAGPNGTILPNRFYYNSVSRKLFYAETQDLLLNIL